MEDSSGQSLLFQSILLLILTLLTAFFSASEMALVSLNRSRVGQKKVIRNLFACSRFLKIQTTSYQLSKLVLPLLASYRGPVSLRH